MVLECVGEMNFKMIYEEKDWKRFIKQVSKRREQKEERKRYPEQIGIEGLETQGAILLPTS
jgi:hypothetical protein